MDPAEKFVRSMRESAPWLGFTLYRNGEVIWERIGRGPAPDTSLIIPPQFYGFHTPNIHN